MNYPLIFIVACLFLSLNVRAGEIAITFDDAPRPDTSLFTGQERAQRLVDSLHSAKVPTAMFFISAGNINPQNKTRLLTYTNAGHQLANHSFNHLSANRISTKAFIEDFDKAHQVLSTLPSYQLYFRFPFLHKGESLQKQNQLLNHLAEVGYSHGYVTVDNFDWYMDNLVQQGIAQGKSIDFDKLRMVYVDVLWQTILFYDNLAIKTFDRSPKHVLLLHENDLAALYVGDLVEHVRANGWDVISPDDAYTDPIAVITKSDYMGNQGRVAGLAKIQGTPVSDLRHESEDEEYLRQLFERAGVFK